jgi:hypothetical protein
MIARHEAQVDKTDIWSALAAKLPAELISWRQEGRAALRDGKHYARFLAYIDANTVRERLDAVVPGEWDLTLDLLPPLPGAEDEGHIVAFKARLQILGVIREDVGTGRDYKSAATDAFKRAAVRFGIGHELYAMEQNWVQVDGEGRHAHPLEDPQAAYDRRPTGGNGHVHLEAEPEPRPRSNGRASKSRNGTRTAMPVESPVDIPDAIEPTPAASAAIAAADADNPGCPKCGGRMWDNRLSKRNPKAPDFKCRDRSCDGVVWPPRDGKPGRPAAPVTVPAEPEEIALDSGPLGDDDIPF